MIEGVRREHGDGPGDPGRRYLRRAAPGAGTFIAPLLVAAASWSALPSPGVETLGSIIAFDGVRV